VKYFFLAEGWTYGRVWEFGGLWNQAIWRRSPEIIKLNCAILQQSEILWLYEVEDAVIMIEVQPISTATETQSNIGQVVLKRLIDAEQAIAILHQAEKLIKEVGSRE
jgi:hypothetical protein